MEYPWSEKSVILHSRLLADSFYFWTKQELIGDTTNDYELSFLMYHSSKVIVSHNTDKDPIFNYANLQAQQLWKINWNDFVQMPSRLSAEPIAIEERQKLLDEASRKGFVDNYSGIRISSDRKKFLIKNTILWNVIDGRGVYHGQAAVFNEFEQL